MSRFVRMTFRGLVYPARAAWRHPRWAVVAGLLVVAVAVLGVRQYALSQWRAAETALASERAAEARDRLTVCLAVWPFDPDVHLLAARAARLTGDLTGAEAHLDRARKLRGETTQAIQTENLLVRLQGGELDEVAPTLLDASMNGHPDAPLLLHTLARGYALRLRYTLAYACYSRLIELRPEDATAYVRRGLMLEKLGNPKGAKEDYNRALEHDPNLVPARLRIAEMLVEDKRVPEAVPHLEELYRRVPDDPHVQAQLGICRFYQGRPDEARALLEAAVVHLPKDPALLVALAKLDVEQNRGAEAERWVRRVLEANPSDNEALYVLMSALQAQGRDEDSAAVLKEYERFKKVVERTNKLLREVDGPTAGAADFAELGTLLLEGKQDRSAVYWLDRALEREPENQPAHRALAAYYEKNGDADKAAAHRQHLRP